jgi:hypothetical protein
VVFSGKPVFLVNIADFSGQNESDGVPAGFGNKSVAGLRDPVFEFKKAGFRRFKLFLDFGKPSGVCEVAGAHHGKTFDLGGDVKIFQIQVFGGGPGVFGVDVKVGDKVHGVNPEVRVDG